MQKNTNTLQYALACSFGGFIGTLIALQFKSNWFYGLVGFALGLSVGWVTAMFTNDPKGFSSAVKKALIKSLEVVGETDFEGFAIDFIHETIYRFGGYCWTAVGTLAFLETVSIGYWAFNGFDITILQVPFEFFLTVLLVCGIMGFIGCSPGSKKDYSENARGMIKMLALYLNPGAVIFYTVIGVHLGFVWLLKHQKSIRFAVKVFLAEMYLYVHQNDGLALLSNVALATGIGFYFEHAIIGAIVGFIAGITDRTIYSNNQHRLIAITVKKE